MALCCWRLRLGAGCKRQLPASRKKTPREALALPPGATCADNNGGKCQSCAAVARTSQQHSPTRLSPAATLSPRPARAGHNGDPSGVANPARPARHAALRCAAPTVSQQAAGGRAGCLGASRPIGSHGAPGGPERPAPPARPPSHTVSQQHHSRLARPLSAASDPHRPRRDGGAAGTTPGPLPMEWRMSMEASRSVLSRDWALWNSTTAAAAILPLSHRTRPRPPTPETHTRKTRPRVPTQRPRLPSPSTPGFVVSLPGGWPRSVPQETYELPHRHLAAI